MIWASDAYGFIRLSDAFTTGSSIMPQKRNPDAAELVRAKTGRLNGSLLALLTVMKGLPLTYQKDMQEDKVPVFETADALELCLAAIAGMVRDMRPDRARMRSAAARGYSTATDLADWLVRELRTCRSGAPITSPAISSNAPRPAAAPSRNCRWRNCRRSNRQSALRFMVCSMSTARWRAAPALAAPRRHGSAKPPPRRAGDFQCARIVAEHPSRRALPPRPVSSHAGAIVSRCVSALPFAGCGKKGAPVAPPGEPDTFPRVYPSE